MPFEGEELWIDRPDGGRVRTRVWGDGPQTVVFAHGYGMDLHEWDVVGQMLPDVRKIALDLRGHGGSTIGSDGIEPSVAAEDYVAVLEAHDVRDAVLVGHSTGASSPSGSSSTTPRSQPSGCAGACSSPPSPAT